MVREIHGMVTSEKHQRLYLTDNLSGTIAELSIPGGASSLMLNAEECAYLGEMFHKAAIRLAQRENPDDPSLG